MQARNSKLALFAGMAAFLLSGLLAQAPATNVFAASQDSMMMEKDGAYALRGNVANVQLDGGEPAWIQSGIWVLRVLPGGDASFIARISMVATDGTSAHTHTISGFSLQDDFTEGDGIRVIEGTADVTAPTGRADDVRVTVKVLNGAAVAVSIDPEALGGHFGTSPIYGTVSKASSAGAMMMEKKLTRTSVPLELPLTRGFAGGSEVFYISTEASDKDLADHLTSLTGSRVAYAPALAGAPAESLANIYAFSNGIEGEGPLGFQPNVADSQPGDAKYSPLWRINVVEWQQGAQVRELRSEQEVLAAASAGEVTVTFTEMVVNCPFVQWDGGSLQLRQDRNLSDDSPYGGGQVLEIDTDARKVTFVAHRGFAPDGSTIYYIATDASVKEVADALGVVHAEKTGAALLTGSASDLWVFTNGIEGTGPMGFQASVAGSDIGDDSYSPLWRILATTWDDASKARFLTTAQEIGDAGQEGALSVDVAGVVVNCPFVEV
ncbi:hypothetical protein [Nitrososphaera sp.]|uniref:DUF7482 domain-containing protein n=1 Tax=Nitrososphaera sp. TaxID=1971748 RepID=UPI00183C6A1F|nr:hypothetical protein [Nitrososphaera sp.]NWG37553.1 hypothetical protein [Nitrososphaera sp.]